MFLLKHFVHAISLILLVQTMIVSLQSSALNVNSNSKEGWNYVRNILAFLKLQVPIIIDNIHACKLKLLH